VSILNLQTGNLFRLAIGRCAGDGARVSDESLLECRLGSAAFARRTQLEHRLRARLTHQGEGVFVVERVIPVDTLLATFLRVTGLARVGRRNYLDVRVNEYTVPLRGLPGAFDGFRVLHVTDLHCDLDPALVDVVVDRLATVRADFAALTGDYHNRIAAPHDRSMELMGRVVAALPASRAAVLGNHDFLAKAPVLERMGLPVLLNENLTLTRGGERLTVCGVDDPHFFRTDDLPRALAGTDGVRVLLSHSPEPFRGAAKAGVALMLCGHTHGGQIRLPGGRLVVHNARCPRRLNCGFWSVGRMTGYTSSGTGACGVAARFFCPPEIAIHTLRTAPES
jgi:hypothetical protein